MGKLKKKYGKVHHSRSSKSTQITFFFRGWLPLCHFGSSSQIIYKFPCHLRLGVGKPGDDYTEMFQYYIIRCIYPLVNSHDYGKFTMFNVKPSLFLWPCSIAMSVITRGQRVYHTHMEVSIVMGVPPNHPFQQDFPEINHPFWVSPPLMEKDQSVGIMKSQYIEK